MREKRLGYGSKPGGSAGIPRECGEQRKMHRWQQRRSSRRRSGDLQRRGRRELVSRSEDGSRRAKLECDEARLRSDSCRRVTEVSHLESPSSSRIEEGEPFSFRNRRECEEEGGRRG